MKWIIVRVVEGAEAPRLEEGQEGLCCSMAEVGDKSGEELLNLIETDAYEIGKQIQQLIFTHQVQALDEQVSCQRIHEEGLGCEVVFDGKESLSFITRFGLIRIPIQQAHCKSHGVNFIPVNCVLPGHGGCITTPSVQELSCLFAALSPSFEVGTRLLKIVLQEPALLSTSKSVNNRTIMYQ